MQVDFLMMLTRMLSPYDLQVTRIRPPFDALPNFDYGLRRSIDPQFDWTEFGNQILVEVPRSVVIFAQGVFELHFAFFRMPDEAEEVVCIGPWSVGKRSQKSIEWTRRNLDEQGNRAVEEFFNAVQVVTDAQILEAGIFSIVSMLYPSGECHSIHWHEFMPLCFQVDVRGLHEPDFKREFPAELVAARYAQENVLLDALSRGDYEAALLAYTQFVQRFRLIPRLRNPVREKKNLTIVLNSLFRKSIERASIHPYYIDEISESFAYRIETVTTEQECEALCFEMVRDYCAYVQKYSLLNHSPIIQKVINYINFNLGTPLSLKSIAEMCFISPSYLSTLFKQEVGQTLTDYINTTRVERAEEKLIRTEANIATIAEEVGVPDVNYFTKIFRKTTGLTPTAYRKKNRNNG